MNKNTQPSSINNNLDLADLRLSIDYLDTAFIFVIAERVRLITKTIALKQEQRLSLDYSERRKHDLQKTIALAVEHHIDENFIRQLFDQMYQQAISMSQLTITYKRSAGTSKLYIQDLQNSMHHIDVALCCLLAERYNLVKQVGRIKKTLGQPPLAVDRWQEVLSSRLTMAAALDIDIEFMKNILENIHQEALRIEQHIIDCPEQQTENK